jgi:hypothetical protein
MADTVATQVIHDGPRKAIVLLTNQSDGTGQSAVTMVTLANLSGAPSRVRVASLKYSTRTISVDLFYKASTNQYFFTAPANYSEEFEFEDKGGIPASNPAASGFTGDIVVTTVGNAANARYWIWLELIKD